VTHRLTSAHQQRVPAGHGGEKADIMMQTPTIEGAMRLLHEVCDKMGGSVQPQFALHKDSIRCAPTLACAPAHCEAAAPRTRGARTVASRTAASSGIVAHALHLHRAPRTFGACFLRMRQAALTLRRPSIATHVPR
jgi:hypothetical protein